ncbi:hypothetical protein IMCC3317_34240 [Kordia antarctica]|uniref:Uncharacterized protein n=1 Tax=Kordia antarctica TaxID=1218801 RepID=A0A7L4ZNG4_9FLAO|nr:hypothetical protein [Kordia antarctica]QHI38040.1 hypothetical protein IMCC3317_34240 [Kordia antarctica]
MFNFIPFDRYLVSMPESDKLGGFYDEKGGGFYYFNLMAFTTLLNIEIVGCEKLVVAELLRNYIHDCIHFSTYRTFRLVDDGKNNFTIYREQYGINYRNQYGDSYSSKDLSKSIPKAINLNLLMDGVNAVYTSYIIDSIFKKDSFKTKNLLNKEILLDLTKLKISNFQLFDSCPIMFYNEVINPCKEFINYWGGFPFICICLKAMFGGEPNLLNEYYEYKTQDKNYWINNFKQANFKI